MAIDIVLTHGPQPLDLSPKGRLLTFLQGEFVKFLSGLTEEEQYRELQSGAYPTQADAEALLFEWQDFQSTASPEEIDHETKPGAHFSWVTAIDEDV